MILQKIDAKAALPAGYPATRSEVVQP
jgi:hypothetical protein